MAELSVYERGLREDRVKRLLALGSLISIILICILPSGLSILSIRAAPMVIVVPDDYSTIQEAINNASDGDTVIVKVGTYYEHVIVNKAVSLVGEDVSATTIDGNGTGRVLDLIRDNVNITNFTVRGGGNIMFPDFDAGISLNNSRGCAIASNNFVDNGCFGIHLLNSDQNTISGNNFTRNAMYAIDLTTSNNNTISSNVATFNANIAIGLHITSHDNIMTGNAIVNNTYGIDAANARNNKISGNCIANNSEIGIWIQDNANNNSISGNTIAGSQLGIKILDSDHTEIFNNTIAHNFHTDEWNAGIRLDSASYSRIYSNCIVDNWRGVLLYANSPHVSIYNNTIDDNEFGIRVASGGSSYLNVSDNIVMNNRGYGIGLTGFGGASNFATISRNIILNNSDGIALGQYSNYNTIVHNSLSQNDYGFYAEYSTQNTIWGNNIINNDQRVYIAAGSINNWDSGYPSGGNYWSDYNGTDLSSGLLQNETGSDGIGDTAWLVDANNIDHYPLKGMFFDHRATSEYHVQTICNSALFDFQFNGTAIKFNVSGKNVTAGFCRICIPTALMNETYHVFVNGTEVLANLLTYSNATHSYLYFSYTHSTQEVVIVPEFPANLVLILFMSSTMLLVACRTKKKLFQGNSARCLKPVLLCSIM